MQLSEIQLLQSAEMLPYFQTAVLNVEHSDPQVIPKKIWNGPRAVIRIK